ncbi:MAG: GxxExxY protein [Roseiflexaceae bacterium]|nr:GxxExxY protein [Roseiflexaceae bacterium]
MQLESTLPLELEILIQKVIGASIEVHRHLGPGFLETIYEQALCFELEQRGIAYVRQKEIAIPYKTTKLTGQRFDLFIEGVLIIELKAVEMLLPIHEAQIMSYLKALHLRAGLLMNFNVKMLKSGIKRIVF